MPAGVRLGKGTAFTDTSIVSISGWDPPLVFVGDRSYGLALVRELQAVGQSAPQVELPQTHAIARHSLIAAARHRSVQTRSE